MVLKINAQVNGKDGPSGIIRYIGPVAGKEGEWAGIELNAPNGSNDGSYNGVRYFKCAPGCGVFVRSRRLESIVNGTPAESSAMEAYRLREKQMLPGGMADTENLEGLRTADSFLNAVEESYTDPEEHLYTAYDNAQRGIKDTDKESRALEPECSLFYDHGVPRSNAELDYKRCAASDVHKTHLESGSVGEVAWLKEENRKLMDQLDKYKETCSRMTSMYEATIAKVQTSLTMLQGRVDALNGLTVTSSEKLLVTQVMEEMHKASLKGNARLVKDLFDKLKSILATHQIKIE